MPRTRRRLRPVRSSVSVPDDLAARIAAEAARRDMSVDVLVVETLEARFPPPQHRLGFAALGASSSGRHARDSEEMLAEGFGRDSLRS